MGDIDALKERNARVEADKAWEVSLTRKIAITLGTYGIVGGYLTFLNVADAWLHAFVPAGAYLLSTLSLPFLKNFWIRNVYRKKERA